MNKLGKSRRERYSHADMIERGLFKVFLATFDSRELVHVLTSDRIMDVLTKRLSKYLFNYVFFYFNFAGFFSDFKKLHIFFIM